MYTYIQDNISINMFGPCAFNDFSCTNTHLLLTIEIH